MTIEQLKQQDKKYAQKIADYLIERCEEDKNLEEKILNTQKTLVGCIKYCKDQAREQAEDGCAIVCDEEVYQWCVHYFLEDSLDFEKETVSKTKKSKEKAPEEEEEIEEPIKEKKPKPTKKKVVKSVLAEQISLFDLE